MRIWGERQRRELFEGTSHHGFHHWYLHQPTMGIVVIILGPTFSRQSQWQAGRGRTPHRRPGPGWSLKRSWDLLWWQKRKKSMTITEMSKTGTWDRLINKSIAWLVDWLIDVQQYIKCTWDKPTIKTWDKPTEMQHPSRCNQVALQLRFLNHRHNTYHNFPISLLSSWLFCVDTYPKGMVGRPLVEARRKPSHPTLTWNLFRERFKKKNWKKTNKC